MSDHLVLMFDRSGYMIRTPGPHTLETAVNHLSKLEPHLAERIIVRTFVEVGRESWPIRPETQDKRDTIPAPAPCPLCLGARRVEVGPNNYTEPCRLCLNTNGCVCGKLASGEATFCAVHSCGVASAKSAPAPREGEVQT
jgi:hypothetical protein